MGYHVVVIVEVDSHRWNGMPYGCDCGSQLPSLKWGTLWMGSWKSIPIFGRGCLVVVIVWSQLPSLEWGYLVVVIADGNSHRGDGVPFGCDCGSQLPSLEWGTLSL